MRPVWVFDLDDTLYPEHQYVLSGFKAVDCWLIQHKGCSGFLTIAKRLFEEGMRGSIFNQTLEELGVSYVQNDIVNLVKVYRNHKPEIELYADAKWILAKLPKDRLGLITDGYIVAQKRKIEALSLGNLFHTIICSDEFGRENWKPSPTPYLKIMEYFGAHQSSYIYVGDNPQKDFISAKSLGWKTIMVKRNFGEYNHSEVSTEYKADHIIENMYHIPNLIDSPLSWFR